MVTCRSHAGPTLSPSHLPQSTAGGGAALKCPDPPASSCVSLFWFVAVVTLQTMAVFGYVMFRQSQERAAKKFF